MATREDELLGFLRTLPDASSVRPTAPLRARDVAQPQMTMGAARPGTQPNLTPQGSAQELNPQRGASLADVADAIVPVRSAGRLGYEAAQRLNAGDVAGAARSTLAAVPLAAPSASIERLLGKFGTSVLAKAAPAVEDAAGHMTAEQLHNWRGIQQHLSNRNVARRGLLADRAVMGAPPVIAPHDAYIRPGVEDMAIPANIKPR